MIKLKPHCPQKTSGRLKNPERGFYAIYKMELSDSPQDVQKLAEGIYTPEDDELLLCEFSLKRFAGGPLSECALGQVREMLAALRKRGGSVILRFLYDWDGWGAASEPDSVDTLIGHIRQLGPLVRAESDMIYMHQGLFTGSWGEMHGTRYGSAEDMKKLLLAMRGAFGPDITIAVRTLAQLRLLSDVPGAGKLGLYNDGITGSVSDLGSYPEAVDDAGREMAIAFQKEACLTMPNGGEAVFDPSYSAYENAVKTLWRMRVSYLNRFHDLKALDGWAAADCGKSGVWKGMDGLSYIERHLGYRYMIRDVRLWRAMFSDTLFVRVVMYNEGFAPAYFPLSAWLIVRSGDKEKKFEMKLTDPVRDGGQSLSAETELKLEALGQGSGKLYFCLRSDKHKRAVLLGNEDRDGEAYYIGGFES